MDAMDLMVKDFRSRESCDVMEKQLMALEGVIEVAIDPTTKIAYVKLNDDCTCSADDVMCKIRDLGYSVNSTNP